jgi:hypothetical protein
MLATYYFIAYCLLYMLTDILLIVAVVMLYKGGAGRMWMKKAVYGLAALSTALGLYGLAGLGSLESDPWFALLTVSIVPLGASAFALFKATSGPAANS